MPTTRYLSTFAERVEVLSAYAYSSYGSIDSTGPFTGYLYSEALTQWLTDGVAEIINLLPQKYKDLMSSEVSFTAGTPDALNTTNISNVTLGDIPCRIILAKLKGRYDESDDINYPTTTDPIYFIENNRIDALPTDGPNPVVKYSELQYPTVEYNHTDIGAINLTGVTATDSSDGTPNTFTKENHGLSNGDRVTLSNVTGSTGLNGTVGIIESIVDDGVGGSADTFKITGLTIANAITDCNITKMGGFPDEAVYLLVLYAAMKGLQYKMAFLMNETVSTQDLDSIVTLMDTATDRLAVGLWDDTDNFASGRLVKVKDALDNAMTLIDDGANSPTGDADADAASHLVNEDIELVKSTLEVVTTELQRAAANLKEWDTIAATALKEAQGYAEVIKTRMSKMAQEYGWYEKQYAILQGDYMRGLSALGARVGGSKN